MDTSLSIYTAHACGLYTAFKLYIDVGDMRHCTFFNVFHEQAHDQYQACVTACVCSKCADMYILYNLVIVCFAAEVEDAKAVIHCLSESILCNV